MGLVGLWGPRCAVEPICVCVFVFVVGSDQSRLANSSPAAAGMQICSEAP